MNDELSVSCIAILQYYSDELGEEWDEILDEMPAEGE